MELNINSSISDIISEISKKDMITVINDKELGKVEIVTQQY